jgi:hypothetical protein
MPEFPAAVSYCRVSETGKRSDVTNSVYLRVHYWNRYWDNNLRLRIEELGRQTRLPE